MNKDFILIDGILYRVAVNWNAISDYCARKGITDLAQLDSIAQFGPDDLLKMVYVCIVEGERMEGRDFQMSEKDLGAEMNIVKMTEFTHIYTRQTSAQIPQSSIKKNTAKKKYRFKFLRWITS